MDGTSYELEEYRPAIAAQIRSLPTWDKTVIQAVFRHPLSPPRAGEKYLPGERGWQDALPLLDAISAGKHNYPDLLLACLNAQQQAAFSLFEQAKVFALVLSWVLTEHSRAEATESDTPTP